MTAHGVQEGTSSYGVFRDGRFERAVVSLSAAREAEDAGCVVLTRGDRVLVRGSCTTDRLYDGCRGVVDTFHTDPFGCAIVWTDDHRSLCLHLGSVVPEPVG